MQIKIGFQLLLVITAAACFVNGSMIWATDLIATTTDNRLVKIEPKTLSITTIGSLNLPSGYSVRSALAYSPNDLQLFVIAGGSSNPMGLYSINRFTGQASQVAELNVPGVAGYEGFAFVCSLGSLVVSESSAGNFITDRLLTLSLDGTSSFLCNNGRDNDYGVYDSTRDRFYTTDPNGVNQLVLVNLNNGANVNLGAIPNTLGPLAYSPDEDVIYAVSYADTKFYRITTTNGGAPISVSLLGNLPGEGYRFIGLAMVPTVSIVAGYVFHGGWSSDGTDHSKTLTRESNDAQHLNYYNLINTAQGINGIVFDIQNLPDTGNLSIEDFEFQVSPTGAFDGGANPPANWQSAPAPSSITVTPGTPDRVLIQWPDQSIMNRWLRITIKSTPKTGLATPETYYIGHLLGETTGPVNGMFTVSFADITPIRAEVGQTVDASSITDIDKNGTVSFADISAMRGNVGSQLTQISVP